MSFSHAESYPLGSIDPLLSLEAVKHGHTLSAVGVEPCTGRLYFSGGGSVLKNQFEGGGVELNDQLLDPDAPTLASQDKLKVSPKGLPFVTSSVSNQTGARNGTIRMISLVDIEVLDPLCCPTWDSKLLLNADGALCMPSQTLPPPSKSQRARLRSNAGK